MPLYEFALACSDEPEAHRKKEGDIIAVRPYPWDWGKKEEKDHLIVILDGLVLEEALKLTVPQWNLGLDWYPSDGQESEILDLKTIAKRRFKLPFDIIRDGWDKTIEFDRIRAKKTRYQPLKDKRIVIDTLERVSIVFDKHRGSFKYSTRKKI